MAVEEVRQAAAELELKALEEKSEETEASEVPEEALPEDCRWRRVTLRDLRDRNWRRDWREKPASLSAPCGAPMDDSGKEKLPMNAHGVVVALDTAEAAGVVVAGIAEDVEELAADESEKRVPDVGSHSSAVGEAAAVPWKPKTKRLLLVMQDGANNDPGLVLMRCQHRRQEWEDRQRRKQWAEIFREHGEPSSKLRLDYSNGRLQLDYSLGRDQPPPAPRSVKKKNKKPPPAPPGAPRA